VFLNIFPQNDIFKNKETHSEKFQLVSILINIIRKSIYPEQNYKDILDILQDFLYIKFHLKFILNNKLN
jgi:hypothetical protein